MQAYDLGRGDSALPSALSLEPWVLKTTVQGLSIQE